MNDVTPAATASSKSVSVPTMLQSTNSRRLWVTMCGLCNVAVCNTASTPCMTSLTSSASAMEPTRLVNGEGSRSTLTTA
jgi:hypothetical protein